LDRTHTRDISIEYCRPILKVCESNPTPSVMQKQMGERELITRFGDEIYLKSPGMADAIIQDCRAESWHQARENRGRGIANEMTCERGKGETKDILILG